MKRVAFLVTIFVAFVSFNHAFAKIHRLGYSGTPIQGVDYLTMQNANDSTSAGDTVYVYPGSYSATLNKKLTWIGYGYFLTGAGSNANLQSISGSLTFYATLDASSSGSVFEGLDGCTFLADYSNVVSNILVRRCNVSNLYFNDQTSDSWNVSQSYVNYIQFNYAGSATNLNVSNTYIYNCNLANVASSLTGQFTNCIFSSANFGNGTINGSFIIKNSILIGSHNYDNNCVYQSCIANGDYYPIPTGNNNKNITNTQMSSSVFVGYATQGSYSNDGAYQLTSTSPAKGAGIGGTDDGIFGGTNPYHLSGIPPVPSFYKVSATSTTVSSNPYTITISVRSNN